MGDLSFWCNGFQRDEDIALAQRLSLPVVEESAGDGLYLARIDECLSLGRFASKEKPIFVDFGNAAQLERLKRGKELLVKAVGGGAQRPSVLDATAGLGRDAFILACHGYPVTLLEREAVLVALLNDALERARKQPVLVDIVERMQLIEADAADFLATEPESESETPDVIYLDPMFSEGGKAAMVKKDLRLLQDLLPAAEDGETLLNAALDKARFRVVVKRSVKAAPLAGRKPSFEIKGKAIRFDVYALRSFDRRD